MSLYYPAEATGSFFWFALKSGYPGSNAWIGPYYLGLCDFPRVAQDAGTYPVDSIGSCFPMHMVAGAGRYDGTARVHVCSGGLVAGGVSAAVALLNYAVRYAAGSTDYYDYLVLGAGTAQNSGGDGVLWAHSGAQIRDLTLTTDAGGELMMDLSWQALYPRCYVNAGTYAQLFNGAVYPPYQWHQGDVVIDGTYYGGVVEMSTLRAVQRARSIYTQGGDQVAPTTAHAAGPKYIVPTIQDTTFSIRTILPHITDLTGRPFNAVNAAFTWNDSINPLTAALWNCKIVRDSVGPHRPDDYLRWPIDYRAQYVSFS